MEKEHSLINSKIVLGVVYRKTFHTPIYNPLEKEELYLKNSKGIILDIGGNIGSFFLLTYWLDTFLLLGFLLRIVMWPIVWLFVQLDRFDKYKLAATFHYGIAVK